MNTEDTLSGFQEFFLQPIIKDRSNIANNCVCPWLGSVIISVFLMVLRFSLCTACERTYVYWKREHVTTWCHKSAVATYNKYTMKRNYFFIFGCTSSYTSLIIKISQIVYVVVSLCHNFTLLKHTHDRLTHIHPFNMSNLNHTYNSLAIILTKVHDI